MSEVLSMADMEQKYPNEWVFVVDPETGPDLKVRAGLVVAHGADRDKVYEKVIHLRPKRSAMLFLGNPFPPDSIFLL